jgi:predicted nucleotidyltransferase/DNA-binding transcriptional ArsR family regulator
MKIHENGRGISGLLDEALGRAPHVRILRYLCQAGGEHTGRAIGRAVNVSHPSVHRALRTLARRGMVEAIRHGPAIVYRLNEEHWLIRTGIRPLFEAEAGLFTSLGEAVQSAAEVPVRSVLVFGSVARGEASAESDIDLLCLTASAAAVADAERNLAAAAPNLRRQFGRRVSVMVQVAADFVRRYRRRERLTKEIVETGWVVAGDSLSEVLR